MPILGERNLRDVVVDDVHAFERAPHDFRIADVAAHEFDRLSAIGVVHEIENPDAPAAFEQTFDDDFSEVAGTAGDQSEHDGVGRLLAQAGFVLRRAGAEAEAVAGAKARAGAEAKAQAEAKAGAEGEAMGAGAGAEGNRLHL